MAILSPKIVILAVFVLLMVFLGLLVYNSLYGIPGVAPTNNNNSAASPVPAVDHTSHPYLLFHNINETPGYQHVNSGPWPAWEKSILSSADSAKSTDFSARWSGDYVSVRAVDARDLALAYQITGDTSYAEKAKDALLNLDLGAAPDAQKNVTELLGYCLAYDWVQPYLSKSDDMTIRDKLATLADTSYKALNWDNTRRDYIETVDYQMQSYPVMGIVGVTLGDYTNPNHLPLSSMPADWQRVGTDYLFVSDALHDYNKSLVSFQWDPTGKDLLGSYKLYYTDDFMWWSQIYTYYYGKNFFDAYPLAKAVFMSELWESLPDSYSNDFVTNGNVIYNYQGAFENLLSDQDRAAVNYYLDSINTSLLPYSRTFIPMDDAGYDYLYLTYQDYSGVKGTAPSWTSHLNASSVYQVFRGSWSDDSDWLGLITYDVNSLSNRNNAHHDQLSFEYYGKGDLLLADAGENRQVLQEDYGAFEIDHNTVAFEDPRHPFAPSTWTNNQARGIFKGSDTQGLVTPSNVRSIVQAPWMELADTSATVTKVIKNNADTSMSLSSPIQYERCVLFPEKDYFIVVDRLEGSQPWVYDNIFRPTSLGIVPSADKNGDGTYTEDEIGHVIGDLSVGGTSYDWLSKPFKDYEATGTNTSLVQWSTTNPYGKDVNLQIFTVPSSQVSVEKYTTRIAGYNAQNEVYSPIVYFSSAPQNSLYRATVLLPSYSNEAQRATQALAVKGNGNAMKVSSAGYTDYIYTGKGNSSFDSFSTDADIVFVRNESGSVEYTLVDGTSLSYNGKLMLLLSDKAGYATFKQDGNGMTLMLKTDKAGTISLFPQNPSGSYHVTMDGVACNSRSIADNTGISIDMAAGEHTYEVST